MSTEPKTNASCDPNIAYKNTKAVDIIEVQIKLNIGTEVLTINDSMARRLWTELDKLYGKPSPVIPPQTLYR